MPYIALTLAQRAAPNGKVQAAFSRMHNEMIAAAESDDAIVIALVRAMLDGMTAGNWPA